MTNRRDIAGGRIPRALDLRFTPELKGEISAFLGRITEYKPTLSLLKSTHVDDPDGSWHFGAYAPRNIEAISKDLEPLGHPLLYAADGLVVAIPQFHLLDELCGKTLARGEGRLLVLDSEPRV